MADGTPPVDSKPARFEVDKNFLEQGGKLGTDIYRMLLSDKFQKEGGANRSFEQRQLYSDQGIAFSERAIRMLEPKIDSLFGYKLSKGDVDHMVESVTISYGSENPLFTQTATEVLITTLESMHGTLLSGVIENAKTSIPGVQNSDSDSELLKQKWASFFQGMAVGTQNELKSGPDSISEMRRVGKLKVAIEEERQKGHDVSKGKDMIEKIVAGLKEREKAGDQLFQFSGRVWSGQRKS